MDKLDLTIGRLAEEAAQGLSRKEFLKILLAAGGATILLALGVDTAAAASCPGITCPVPCGGTGVCIQKAVHYSCHACGGTGDPCPSSLCGLDQVCRHTCRRCCYPSQCTCDGWYVSYKCVDLDVCGNPCPPATCYSCQSIPSCFSAPIPVSPEP